MAKKRVPVNVHPSPSEDTASLEVAWSVDGADQPPESVGPEGNPHLVLGTIDVPDDGSVTVAVKVTPIDTSGNRQPVAAEASRTFVGKDTTAPETPPAPEILDLEDEQP